MSSGAQVVLDADFLSAFLKIERLSIVRELFGLEVLFAPPARPLSWAEPPLWFSGSAHCFCGCAVSSRGTIPANCDTSTGVHTSALAGCDTVPANCDTIPARHHTIPSNCNAIPTGYHTIPRDCDAIPAIYNTIPSNYNAIPEGYNTIPEDCVTLPAGTVSQTEGDGPAERRAASQDKPAASLHSWGVFPEPGGVWRKSGTVSCPGFLLIFPAWIATQRLVLRCNQRFELWAGCALLGRLALFQLYIYSRSPRGTVDAGAAAAQIALFAAIVLVTRRAVSSACLLEI